MRHIQVKERHLISNNKTPLHIAAENDSIKIGELLISKGADINAKDIIYQIIKKLFLIIQKQNKERNLNKNNQTPYRYAEFNQMGSLLRSKGAHY